MKVYRLTVKFLNKGSIVQFFHKEDDARGSAILLEANEPELWKANDAHFSIEEVEVMEKIVDLR